MGFSDRILGKKSVNGGPHIESVSPVLALAGGRSSHCGLGIAVAAISAPARAVWRRRGRSRDQFGFVSRGPRSRGSEFGAGGGCHRRARQQRADRQGGRPDRRELASRDQSGARSARQHLRDFLGFARPKGSGRDLQDRYQLRRKTVRRGDDERNRHRLRSPGADVCFLAL